MKIFFKAGNSANVGLLIIRFALGSMFLLAGAKKVFNLRGFHRECSTSREDG